MTTETALAISPVKAGEIMEAVIVKGDLDQLSPTEKAKYYVRVCESIGLNPMTKPFEYIKLNGRLRLYALKDATDQLRKIYNVSVTDLIESERDGVFIVTAKVRDGAGRTDAAKGAVALKGLSGEALANALMKTETKAKRRATLSICGLGFLDETEVEDIPTDVKRYSKTKQDAKDLYSALQLEVDELTSGSAARAWLVRNDARLQLLPLDWEQFLRTRCADRMQDAEGAAVVTSTLGEMPETGDVIWGEPEQDATPPEWSDKWEALGPVKQAGILCADASFCRFLQEMKIDDGCLVSPRVAADFVRMHCKVKSRADIRADNYTGQLWRDLVAEYRAWQRDEIPASPGIVSSAAADQAAPAGIGVGAGAATLSMEDMAREAAQRGRAVFDTFYSGRSRTEQATLRTMKAELNALMPKADAAVD